MIKSCQFSLSVSALLTAAFLAAAVASITGSPGLACAGLPHKYISQLGGVAADLIWYMFCASVCRVTAWGLRSTLFCLITFITHGKDYFRICWPTILWSTKLHHLQYYWTLSEATDLFGLVDQWAALFLKGKECDAAYADFLVNIFFLTGLLVRSKQNRGRNRAHGARTLALALFMLALSESEM